MQASRRASRAYPLLTLASLALLALGFLVVILIGDYPLPPSVLADLLHGRVPLMYREVLNIRLTRALTGLLVGGSLALSGAALQAITRNPLASPFTLGVSQAAGFGAAAAIVALGAGSSSAPPAVVQVLNPYLISTAAFASAVIALAFMYAVSLRGGMTPTAVVLAGVAVGFLFQALTMLVEYVAPSEVLVAEALFWMFGDISRTTWTEVGLILVVTVILYIALRLRWMHLNAVLLGDETAYSLGVELRRFRGLVIALTALATAVDVSFVGVIGFIGLIAPHIARLLVGRNYRLLLPLSFSIGSCLLLLADEAGRLILKPNTLPVGVTISLIGAPLLVVLLRRGGEHGW